MVPTEEPADAGARLDELRRRLYRPGATEEDRRRYSRALAGTARAAPPEADAASPDAPAARRRVRAVPATAVVLALALGGAGLAAQVGRASASGATPEPTLTAVPAPALARTTDDGRTISRGKDFVAASRIRSPGRASVQEFHGWGDAAVPLDVSALPFSAGRVSVVLAASETGPIAWRAVRLESRRDWSSFDRVLAERAVTERRGVAIPIDFPYEDGPPMRVDVRAPAGVRWTLVVAFDRLRTPASR